MEEVHYIIRGGVDGKERLRRRVTQPTTLDLLKRGGDAGGNGVSEVGCGRVGCTPGSRGMGLANSRVRPQVTDHWRAR